MLPVFDNFPKCYRICKVDFYTPRHCAIIKSLTLHIICLFFYFSDIMGILWDNYYVTLIINLKERVFCNQSQFDQIILAGSLRVSGLVRKYFLYVLAMASIRKLIIWKWNVPVSSLNVVMWEKQLKNLCPRFSLW